MTVAQITDVPLRLHVEFPNGKATLRFDDAPCQTLARQLARTLLTMCNTGGGVKSRGTASNYASSIRRYVRWLDAQGFCGGVADLRPEHVSGYLYSGELSDQQKILVFKSLMRRLCSEYADVVASDTVAHAHTRHNLPKSSIPLAPYSEGEVQRLISACKRAINEIEERLEQGREILARGSRPQNDKGWEADENLLWLLNHYGPGPRGGICKAEGHDPESLNRQMRARDGKRSWKDLRRLLWPDGVDLVPFLLLLGLRSGISPEGITSLRVNSAELLGEGKVRVSWFKARGGGLEADTFSAQGRWSTGALINRALSVTASLRAHADNQEPLWLSATKEGISPIDGISGGSTLGQFVAEQGLLDDQGQPLLLDRRRLRKTYYARLDRRYHGAVNIIAGVNQSAQVAADHYLSATTANEQIVEAVEQTQHMLLARAEASRRITILTETQVSELAADPDEAASTLGLPVEQAALMLTTIESDVFAAKCKDFHNGPHGAPGQPCPAAVWECLFCPLAVVTPTKLPNLLRLLDHIDAQSRRLELGEWQRRYLAARRAIKEQILPQFDPEVIEAARSRSAHVSLYLPPEESFQ